jgi:hypothetical protein
LRGGDRGPAIVSGNASISLLYKLTSHAAEPHMPLKQAKLAAPELARLSAWIDSGAPYVRRLAPPPSAVATELWSLRPLRPIEPPAETDAWCRTPVDRFILHALRAKGLSPSPQADKRTLIRRATYDLTGLPPTPDEVEAFVKDESPEAWPRVVDRLLASPAYGERWARHWLDVARYADSDGYELDDDRPNAYQYRDFVIRAFNDDLPFDTFIRWSLAGDEFEPDNVLARAATGFCTAGPQVVLTSAIGIGTPLEREKNRYDELDNVVSTVGQAFLGLSVGCARCHDHKFDPVSIREYYRLVATFASSKRVERFLLPAKAEREYQARVDDFKHRREQPGQELDAWVESWTARVRAKRVAALPLSDEEKSILLKAEPNDPGRLRLIKQFSESLVITVDDLRKEMNPEQIAHGEKLQAAAKVAAGLVEPEAPPKVLCLADAGRQPVKSFLLVSGDPTRKAEEVHPGFLSVLSSAPAERWTKRPHPEAPTTYARAALAEWMVDREAGAGRLVARVMVNRLWQHHFGEGLVRTPNDFGTQGAPPTHPELLDWLANDFIAGGWKVKRLQRYLLLSAVYTQASNVPAERRNADVDGKLLSYRRPMRLEAEALRDAILAVSGRLDRTMYGPAVKAASPPQRAADEPGPAAAREDLDGAAERRRSIYLFVKRSRPLPILTLFDAPAPTDSCGRRYQATVAGQALHLLNSQFVRDQAGHFAARVEREAGDRPEARVRRAYQLALGRPPDDEELRDSVTYLRRGTPSRMLANFCHVLLTLNEFCYVD